MKIAIASDHGGYELKENIKKYLESRDIEIVDLGTYSEESVDYPAFGNAAEMPWHQAKQTEASYAAVQV